MVMHHHLQNLDADIIPAEQVLNKTSGRAQRTFDLPPALFAMTIIGYFAFVAVMGLAFMGPGLVVPFAIFLAYIAMAFAVPGMWARIQPAQRGRVQSWAEFMREGVATGSGWLGGGAAVAQVITLPVLILCWGVAVAIIKMTV
jgi:hypothetical protein